MEGGFEMLLEKFRKILDEVVESFNVLKKICHPINNYFPDSLKAEITDSLNFLDMEIGRLRRLYGNFQKFGKDTTHLWSKAFDDIMQARVVNADVKKKISKIEKNYL